MSNLNWRTNDEQIMVDNLNAEIDRLKKETKAQDALIHDLLVKAREATKNES